MKRALSISEAAKYACVSRGTVYNWINSGVLPFEELPGRGQQKPVKRIRYMDLTAFLDKHYSNQKREEKTGQLILLPRTNKADYV